MPKVDDRSEEHLTWLVRSRSDNQAASLKLYLSLEKNLALINSSIELQAIAQALTAIAFSLWRAVFLSDLRGDVDDQMADVTQFLGNLISNNTIAYQQDKNAREFTFRYYLTDAQFRLESIANKTPAILDAGSLERIESEVKDDWTGAQNALVQAIDNFDAMLGS